MKGFAFFLCTLLLFSARIAAADDYDDCRAECTKAETACVDAITLYDETGVKEAKQACSAEHVQCDRKCHQIEDVGRDAYEAAQKKAAEEAERKRKQEEDTVNGTIPIIRFDQ
ncbi:hypothetical protein [Geomesophilobacter sediminis]|uniref:Uncharacterized protein n=1 Tax=Geomesophilobacter sediminis TaxID=2798584 RepID=A0A8J7M237_9BACT|nr:hypothetical protein [Geomesophilobacter sediminis]MBJ6727290.1 hypothetical protein [Geomesophilobacter sediminis]